MMCRDCVLGFLHQIPVMAKSKIEPAGSSTPVVHVAWQTFKSRRGSIDRMVKATPWKKPCHGRGPSNHTPTQSGSTGVGQSQLCPDDYGEAYPSMDDLPPWKMTGLSKNQVWFIPILYLPCPPESIIGQLLIGMAAIQAKVPPGASGYGGTPLSEALHSM